MHEYRNLTALSRSSICLFASIGLYGCASQPEAPIEVPTDQVAIAKPTEHSQKISDSERQLAEKQRLCINEKKKLEASLKEQQKQNEELRKKLDALLTIDRDLRNRGKAK